MRRKSTPPPLEPMSYEEIAAYLDWRRTAPEPSVEKWRKAEAQEQQRRLRKMTPCQRQSAKFQKMRDEQDALIAKHNSPAEQAKRAHEDAWDTSHPFRASLRTILGVGAALALLGAATPFFRASLLLPVHGFSWDSTFTWLFVGLLLALGSWLVAIGRSG